MNTMEGAVLVASSKRSRTRLAPTPTYSSTKSEPEMDRKGTPASPATALASRVLPVPGGPTSRMPLGMCAPRAVYFSGSLRKSTTSSSSAFSSCAPATSRKLTFFFICSAEVNLALPNWDRPPPPPLALFCRTIIMSSRKTMATESREGRRVTQLTDWVSFL